MSKSPNFLTRMIAVVVGVLLLVASAAFLAIPYSLGGHPGEVVSIGASPQSFHLS